MEIAASWWTFSWISDFVCQDLNQLPLASWLAAPSKVNRPSSHRFLSPKQLWKYFPCVDKKWIKKSHIYLKNPYFWESFFYNYLWASEVGMPSGSNPLPHLHCEPISCKIYEVGFGFRTVQLSVGHHPAPQWFFYHQNPDSQVPSRRGRGRPLLQRPDSGWFSSLLL